MKKQLFLLALGACIALPLFAIVKKRKHSGGKRKELVGSLRQDYKNTFKLIHENAHTLNAEEKRNLVSKLTAHFNGISGTVVFNQNEAKDIYDSATKTFDSLKKLEASRAAKKIQHTPKLGTEGKKKRHYSPSVHFAQKVLGTILFPNPLLAIHSMPKTKPIGPEIPKTKPVGPEQGKRVKMGPANPIRTSKSLPINKGPQSGSTRALSSGNRIILPRK
jgi:hypothetical protein